MKKILLIDGQIFQTEARDRGMGRYSARLVQSIIEQNYYDGIQMILAKSGHTNHLAKSVAEDLFPSTELVYLGLDSTLKGNIDRTKERNKKVINQHVNLLAGQDFDIDFLVPSPFQEPVVSVYPDKAKKIVVFYDLIPYLYHTRYEPLMPFKNYLKRFDLLFNADVILSISQSVKDDLITYLGLLSDRIITIDGAAIKSQKVSTKPVGIDLPQHYILMPTSDDPRKNNLRAVIGFEEFRAQQPIDYKLIITSKIHTSERRRLELFSSNIIFTGNLKEENLDWLYVNSDAVLFVPESEGLGLPILEAVHANKKVICSDLNVFKEISKKAFYYCDYEDQHAIAGAIIRAMQNDNTTTPVEEYERILSHYSWEKTGHRAIGAMKRPVRKLSDKPKPRIAVLAPRPDGLSAVGKVVAEGHASLSEIFDVDYYVEKGLYEGSMRPNFLQFVANCHDSSIFSVEKYARYDAVFYHVGNSDYHVDSIANALYLPGVIILHDTNITEAYRIMLEKNMITQERYDAEGRIDDLLNVQYSSHLGSIINSQRALLAHSKYALTAARANSSANKALFIDASLPTNTPSISQERPYDNPIVGLAGILAGIKGTQIIEDLAGSEEFKSVQFKLFGYDFTGDDTIERLSDHNNVTVSVNLTDFDFQNNLRKLDIFVNYRIKYQGETSLSTLEAMRYGVVVIVRNIGWYSELPDDVVIKVSKEEDVRKALENLIKDPKKMREIAKKAKEYVNDNHTHLAYANAMENLMKSKDFRDNNKKLITNISDGYVRTVKEMLSLVKRLDGKK